jgi:hypothetical protein
VAAPAAAVPSWLSQGQNAAFGAATEGSSQATFGGLSSSASVFGAKPAKEEEEEDSAGGELYICVSNFFEIVPYRAVLPFKIGVFLLVTSRRRAFLSQKASNRLFLAHRR